jgi:hypothetical protein
MRTWGVTPEYIGRWMTEEELHLLFRCHTRNLQRENRAIRRAQAGESTGMQDEPAVHVQDEDLENVRLIADQFGGGFGVREHKVRTLQPSIGMTKVN